MSKQPQSPEKTRVTKESIVKSEPTKKSWESLNLSKKSLSLVKKAGFAHPTAIQAKCIEVAIEGRDLIVSAPTGSGKTAGFCLPMIERLRGRKGTFGLILCPTREIAQQTHRTLEQFGEPHGIVSIALIGGVRLAEDMVALKKEHQIIVGTPGRINDHLERGNLWLEYIEILVLDEADHMLDMGFAKAINRIIREIQGDRQTLLFSATIPPEIEKLCQKALRKPKKITVGNPKATSTNVEQDILWVNERHKKRELLRILQRERGSVLVFCRTKDGAARLWRWMHAANVIDSSYLSSSRRQQDREEALKGFQDGKYRVLVATDVAGRGIHVDNVGHVINFDVPEEANDYIHRIGRTGRKGSSGAATTFATPDDEALISRVLRRVSAKVYEHSVPDYDPDDYSRRPRRSGRSGTRSKRSSRTSPRSRQRRR